MSDESNLSKSTRSLFLYNQQNNSTYRQTIRLSIKKTWETYQIIEICLLILIFLEHTFIFVLTFKRRSPTNVPKEQTQRSIILPSQSFLYSCLHRNWICALSFSNICLSIVNLLFLILNFHNPTLVHQSSITFYSLPLNLLQQILTNFNTFHLFIISISVFQYFLRYYRLIKNTYSSYFFNGENLLLTNHTNVALILSGSLALIFAYNYIFYAPQYPHTITLLPLITFNMILLPVINVIIFIFVFICLLINQLFTTNFEKFSNDNEQENLRLIIEKSTCIKCYTEILQKNPNLFQDKNYSYKNFFSKHFRSSYPFELKRKYQFFTKQSHDSQTDFTYDQEHNCENDLFLQTTLIHLNHQHSICHLSYDLLLIVLFKYILLTFPQYTIQMITHLKQFYQLIIKHNLSTTNLTYTVHENKTFLSLLPHFLFLLSRFGDSLFFIRLTYLIKNYFPCWCQFNSKLLRQKQIAHRRLTTKPSQSSTNDPLEITNNEIETLNEQQKQIHYHPRFRLKFQFMPIWSRNRPRIFQESM